MALKFMIVGNINKGRGAVRTKGLRFSSVELNTRPEIGKKRWHQQHELKSSDESSRKISGSRWHPGSQIKECIK